MIDVQWRRLFLCLGLAILVVIGLTPICVGSFDLSPRKTSVNLLRFGFLAMALWTAHRSGPDKIAKESGLLEKGSPLGIWLRGFLFGAGTLSCYLLFLHLVDERAFEGSKNWTKFSIDVLKYIPLSLGIGFLEDLLFFGFLFAIFNERILPCSFFYAITHFLSPSKNYHWEHETALAGWEALQAMGASLLEGFSSPIELLGLLLVGIVLCLARAKTGSIWLGMGIHGGWYYVRTISRKISEDLNGNWEWLFGTDRFYDGILGWIVIAATALAFRTRARTKE